MTKNETATRAFPITRAWLISELRALAAEAKKYGDQAAADDAMELIWRIAAGEHENHTPH